MHVAWKGEEARQVELVATFQDEAKSFEWSIRLTREGYDFSVREEVCEILVNKPPTTLLSAEKGRGWIEQRSQSFQRFLTAIRNGAPADS